MNQNPFDSNPVGGTQTQSPDIPVLKPRKEEKKGAGIVIPASAAAPAGLAAGAGMAKGIFGGKFGLAALGLALGGAGLVGYGAMQGNTRAKTAAAPALDTPEAMLGARKRDAQGSKSLAFMQKASQGELAWDPAQPNAAGAVPKAADEKTAEAESAMPDADALTAQAMAGAPGEAQGRIGGQMSGSKLSTSIGGGASFGKKNIFSSGSGFQVKSMQNLGGKTSKIGGGKLQAGSRAKGRLASKNLSTSGVTANRAMGQLKFAGKRSHQAANVEDSLTQRSYSADAFEGQTTNGAAGGPTGGGLGTGEVGPLGGGAPDVMGSEFNGPAPGAGTNVTPYQGNVDSAEKMTQTALMMAVLGAALVAVGIAIMAASSWTGIGAVIGGIIIAIGVGMLVMSMIMSMQAQDQGKVVGDRYGQEDQERIIDRHADNANSQKATCDHKEHCELGDKSNTIRQDVAAERDATYSE